MPQSYLIKNETIIGKVINVCIKLNFGHFFDEAIITSKIRGNQVGYCVKSQQQVEATQFAPDIVIPVENIHLYQD